MAIDRSLILLKPDCLDGHHAGEVIDRFEKAGFEIRGTKLIVLTDELLKDGITGRRAAENGSSTVSHSSSFVQQRSPRRGSSCGTRNVIL